MKILSVTTNDLDQNNKIVSFSKTVFKNKPSYNGQCPFDSIDVRQTIIRHIYPRDGVKLFNVVVSTTKGKFIQGYYPGAIKNEQ